MNYLHLSFYFIYGLVAITGIATLGAVASRKFEFKYSAFIILSLVIYISMGYFISKDFEFKRAVLVNGLLGLYDGTIGFWLSLKLKANTGISDKELEVIKGKPSIAITMVVLAIVFAAIGYSLTTV